MGSTMLKLTSLIDEEPDVNEALTVPFVIGDSVKVTEGPFSGFSGTVEKIDDEKKKVTVTVKVFGRSTGLDLGFMQVEKE